MVSIDLNITIKMLAVNAFIAELELFASKEWALIFHRQQRFNFFFGNDEFAEIFMYI